MQCEFQRKNVEKIEKVRKFRDSANEDGGRVFKKNVSEKNKNKTNQSKNNKEKMSNYFIDTLPNNKLHIFYSFFKI